MGRSVRQAMTARASGLPRRFAMSLLLVLLDSTNAEYLEQSIRRRAHVQALRCALPTMSPAPVAWRGCTNRHAPVRHLTWGCVASISTVEVGEASRRRRNVVKKSATCRNANTNEGNLALAA